MATFNSTAIFPPVGLMCISSVTAVWNTECEALQVFGNASINSQIDSVAGRFLYVDGYADGELFGYSRQREDTMEPIQPGETDDDKKTISFRIYTSTGLPASGLPAEGDVVAPVGVELQTNRDLTGYVNSLGVFSHFGDGSYRYTFATSEVAAAGGEGNIWLRVKVSGFRTVVLRVPLRNVAPTANAVRDAVLNAVRSGFVGTGTIGEGIALAAALLQGNYYMDTVTNTVNGQTAARLRCFHDGIAAAAATDGGVGQGEFATFLVTTSYSGPNKIVDHRVVQQ
jgi:hypothetical protein